MKMNFKTLFIVLAFLVVGMSLNAQEKKTTFGVKAGMNVTNYSGDIQGTDAKIGFNVGVTLDYEFANSIYLLTGLDFTTKGAKVDGSNFGGELGGLNVKATLNPMYLQVPIHIGYKLSIADNTKLVFRAGPYIAYGVGGKFSAEAGNQKEDIGIFRSELMKNFDFGLGLGVGAEFGKIGVNLGYDFGLLNVWDIDGVNVRNGSFNVGLGYKF